MNDVNQKDFDKISNHPLQSWQWGEFRKAWGNEVIRFPFGQITVHKLPYSNFKIGVFEKGIKPSQETLTALKEYARKNNLIFIKLEPNVLTDSNESTIKLLEKNGCVNGRRLFTPTTFWIDLTKSEEEILKSFSSKTRYNIRLSEKHGVKIIENNSEKAFEKYLNLTFETAGRQGFYAHSEKYHRLMWKYLHTDLIQNGKNPIARLLTAIYKGEIITTWVVFVWKDFLYYPYGASSTEHKEVMANNLMMWEAVKYGKKLGLKTFDLWGREEGKGFTKFKEGYNPKVIDFIGSWDMVINKPFYWVYRLAESIRWALLRSKAKF